MTICSEEVTKIVFRFREALRHNWNTYFLEGGSPMNPSIQEAYSLVEDGLFKCLVLYELTSGENVFRYRQDPLPFLKVVARPEMTTLSFRFGSSMGAGMRWEPPERVEVDPEMNLEFVQFFDWLPYEQVDMSLIQVRIVGMKNLPHLVDSYALLDGHEVRFTLAELPAKS